MSIIYLKTHETEVNYEIMKIYFKISLLEVSIKISELIKITLIHTNDLFAGFCNLSGLTTI